MRTVFFDVDGVVVHGFHANTDMQRRWDNYLLQDLGIDPLAFTDAFIRGVFAKEVIPGRKSLVNALEDTLPALGYNGPILTLVDYWLTRDSQVNLPLISIIKRLGSTDARLFLATNQEHLRAFHLWSTLGLRHLFEDIHYSARLGAAKPNREFFQQVSTRIGKQDEPPLLFDDSPSVVAAANDFGWEAVLYQTLDDCSAHPWIASRLK